MEWDIYLQYQTALQAIKTDRYGWIVVPFDNLSGQVEQQSL